MLRDQLLPILASYFESTNSHTSLDRPVHLIILDHPLGTVAAGLATAACIMGILCLPVLLVLVYRQRQRTQSSRREYTHIIGFMNCWVQIF